MHLFKFSFTFGAGLLLHSAAAFTIRLPHLRRQDPSPVPGPEVELLTDRKLTDLAAPFLPPPINGFIHLAAFRPKAFPSAHPRENLNITNISPRGPGTPISTTRILPNPPPIVPLDVPVGATSRFPQNPPAILAPVPAAERLSPPYLSIGKVTTRNAAGSTIGTCTGTLVGSHIFLTALHCVQNKPPSWSLTFTPAFDSTSPPESLPSPAGVPVPSSKCYGLKNGGISAEAGTLSGTDYVICVLDSPVGLHLGYLGTNTPDPANPVTNTTYLSKSWFSVGYPSNRQSGQVPIRADNVWIGRVEKNPADAGNRVLATHPFADKGWSGGPLYGLSGGSGDAEVIGVLSGMRVVTTAAGTRYTASLYGGGPRLTRLVAWGRCEWPGWEGECS
ncbi:hypothetical protein QBC34DRAFT_472577 [Podospora aff. communis PSN243]|uniref:Peptidase S1 domain-containing protein n=1 Tax=Podospora aff. communis PSN243 TaxID=3040156 RepID=A0AAV9GCE0_9PEZI|nr:hypothetical protein QBC34DRAFT_472577 [Podospora aff. communis PSN243]